MVGVDRKIVGVRETSMPTSSSMTIHDLSTGRMRNFWIRTVETKEMMKIRKVRGIRTVMWEER